VTARTIDRAEALELIPARVGAVGGRDEDNVPFIALDVFKILDK